MDYKIQYFKYKSKYLKLKNALNKVQTGGHKNKIFDLNKKYPEYKKGELQKNLIDFEKEFGKNFTIKYNDIMIEVILEKAKLPTGLVFYRMTYDIPKRKTNLVPFIIEFIDNSLYEKNNNTYIAHIQKTDTISGSDMVKICLEINRILGAEKTLLGDGTKVNCSKTNEQMDLSFFKLIEKNMTFYMGLGFDFEVGASVFYPYMFTDKNKFKKEISRLIHSIRKIKTMDIIKEYDRTLNLCMQIIKNNDTNKLEIILNISNPTNPNLIMYSERPNIEDLINESIDVLKILNKYKNTKYFYKTLVKLFKESCDEYCVLNKYIITSSRLKIIYKNNVIKRDYVKDFELLKRYRNNYPYSYTF